MSVTTSARNGATSVPATTLLIPLRSRAGSPARIRPSTISAAIRIRNTSTSVPKTSQPLPRTRLLLYPKDSSAPDWPMTMAGTITAQMVRRNRPGTMRSSSPIPIPKPARIDAPATRPTYRVAADTVSPERQVNAAVPDVLHRFDQGCLDQEGRDDPHDRGEQRTEDTQQPGQGRGDNRREDVNDEGDREQVRGEGPVELPRLAEHSRKGFIAEIVRGKDPRSR